MAYYLLKDNFSGFTLPCIYSNSLLWNNLSGLYRAVVYSKVQMYVTYKVLCIVLSEISTC